MSVYKRSLRVLGVTVLIYGLLVVTHLGEFWPFSIYPMFSRGGHPWSRTVVRDVTDGMAALPWDPVPASSAPGEPFPLVPNGIDPIDLANFVSKTKTWDEQRVAALNRMFYDQLDERRLLVMRVNGRISGDDSVLVDFVPYALLTRDSTVLNPSLPR